MLAAAFHLAGSSPLARGLPGASAWTWDASWDHPRSRGVYLVRQSACALGTGSSPLARGLLVRSLLSFEHGWIIPARAGFTPSTYWVEATRPDHPRSRGVYPCTARRRARNPGSSPLARGLLILLSDGREDDGIIPARAGFTRPSSSSPWSSRDHPRSRGVYRWRCSPNSLRLGSSPLARGLLSGLPDGLHIPRIIPARAGFTRHPSR